MKTYKLFLGELCPNCLFGIATGISEYNQLKREAIKQGYSPANFIKG